MILTSSERMLIDMAIEQVELALADLEVQMGTLGGDQLEVPFTRLTRAKDQLTTFQQHDSDSRRPA